MLCVKYLEYGNIASRVERHEKISTQLNTIRVEEVVVLTTCPTPSVHPARSNRTKKQWRPLDTGLHWPAHQTAIHLLATNTEIISWCLICWALPPDEETHLQTAGRISDWLRRESGGKVIRAMIQSNLIRLTCFPIWTFLLKFVDDFLWLVFSF